LNVFNRPKRLRSQTKAIGNTYSYQIKQDRFRHKHTSAIKSNKNLESFETIEVSLKKSMIEKSADTAKKTTTNKPKVDLGGVELSPELIAILTVYFVQGALGLSRLAVSFFMKDELHLSPTDMAAIGGVTSLPWVIKPIYGFLSDGVPIFGYKRRSYLIIAGIMGCLSWLALGTIVTDAQSAVAAIVIGSASVAVSDVVADSIVVEKSRVLALPNIDIDAQKENLNENSLEQINDEANSSDVASGDLQSLCWSAAAIGGILSAYFSGIAPRLFDD
jgi:hypothetical protein